MATLHLIFCAPGVSTCGKFSSPGDAAVLMNAEALAAAERGQKQAPSTNGLQWFAIVALIAPDPSPAKVEELDSPANTHEMSATQTRSAEIQRINYDDLVTLVVRHDSVVSWD